MPTFLTKLMFGVLLTAVSVSAVAQTPVSSYWYRGNQVLVETLDGVTVEACLFSSEGGNRIDFRIVNDSKASVDVQPELISIQATDPKPAALKVLSEHDIQKSISSRLFFANLLIGFSAALSSQTSTVSTTGNGFYARTTITTPDYGAQVEARHFQRHNSQAADAARQEIHDIILRRTTVFPAEEPTLGTLFFKHPGKVKGLVVTVPFGKDRSFNLPFGTATPLTAVATVRPELRDIPTSPQASQPVAAVAISEPRTPARSPSPFALLGFEGKTSQFGGVDVTYVSPEGPIANAGVHAADTVTAVNGIQVRTVDDLTKAMSTYRSGPVKLTVMHGGWQWDRVVALR